MTNKIKITVRAFPVLAYDTRTGTDEAITVTLTRQQLQAAQICGQSSRELIKRMCGRQGYSVIEIGIPSKQTVTVDLDKLVQDP